VNARFATTSVDIEMPLPPIWTFDEVGPERRTDVEAELVELLGDAVDDPAAVAAASYDEFMERVGGGSAPLLVASFREEMDDGSVLSASLTVSKNAVTGDLAAWSDAYPGSDVITVADEPALRAFEQATVEATGLFDEPLTVSTWRYVVAFDRQSVLLFTFSSPNAELGDLLDGHFDGIMADVRIIPSGDPLAAPLARGGAR
jgi:hypothetical protein